MVSCKVYAMDCFHLSRRLSIIEPKAYGYCATVPPWTPSQHFAPNFASWFSRQKRSYIGIKK